ncbi:MAG: sulfite exporter TauE/SafE family protein [Armatimonadetes bacterium]|nr:sulfite exporter TauE/SafE family protein [Armatimonadota bacterium]
MDAVLAIVIGLVGGVFGGVFGVGGGIVLVPGMVYLLGFAQHRAQGTSLLTLLLPVGLFGVIAYHKEGQIDFRVGLLIAAGFLGGAYLGSKFALSLPEVVLRRCFAAFLLVVAVQLFAKK